MKIRALGAMLFCPGGPTDMTVAFRNFAMAPNNMPPF